MFLFFTQMHCNVEQDDTKTCLLSPPPIEMYWRNGDGKLRSLRLLLCSISRDLVQCLRSIALGNPLFRCIIWRFPLQILRTKSNIWSTISRCVQSNRLPTPYLNFREMQWPSKAIFVLGEAVFAQGDLLHSFWLCNQWQSTPLCVSGSGIKGRCLCKCRETGVKNGFFCEMRENLGEGEMHIFLFFLASFFFTPKPSFPSQPPSDC